MLIAFGISVGITATCLNLHYKLRNDTCAKPLSESNDIIHANKHQKMTLLSSVLVRTVLLI